MSDLPPESGDSQDDSNTRRDVRRVGRDDQKPELQSHGPLFPADDDDPFAFNNDDDLFAFDEEDSAEAARSDAALLTLTPDDEVLLALDDDARQQLAGLVGEVDMDTLLDIDPSLTAIGDDATKAQIEAAPALPPTTSAAPPEPPATLPEAPEREIPEEDLPFAPPQVRARRGAKPPTTAAEVDKALGEFKFEDEPGTVDAPLMPPLNVDADADTHIEAVPEAQSAPPPAPPSTAVEVPAKPSKPSRPSKTKATATGKTKAVKAAEASKPYAPDERFPPATPAEMPRPKRQPRPEAAAAPPVSRKRNWLPNIVTLLFSLGTIGLAVYFIYIAQNPYSSLNLLAPPTPLPILVSATPPPTETPTVTPTASFTPIPAAVLQETFAPDTATPSASATPAPPTVTFTPAPDPFTLANSGVIYAPYSGEEGCNWSSIAGAVTDLYGEPVNGYTLEVSGEGFNERVTTGDAPDYGPGGYEVGLSAVPQQAAYQVHLLDGDSDMISESVLVITSTRCDQNVVIVNFVQNHAVE